MELDDGGEASSKLLCWTGRAKGGPVFKQQRVLASLGQKVLGKMEAGFELMEYGGGGVRRVVVAGTVGRVRSAGGDANKVRRGVMAMHGRTRPEVESTSVRSDGKLSQ